MNERTDEIMKKVMWFFVLCIVVMLGGIVLAFLFWVLKLVVGLISSI